MMKAQTVLNAVCNNYSMAYQLIRCIFKYCDSDVYFKHCNNCTNRFFKMTHLKRKILQAQNCQNNGGTYICTVKSAVGLAGEFKKISSTFSTYLQFTCPHPQQDYS